MNVYVRPPLDLGTYLDESGVPIPYGRRWQGLPDGGPDDTYSVCRHPERFAPLLDVARALVDHLVTTYDVEHEVHGTTHRLTPRERTSSPLEVTFTDMPGVTCHAGIGTPLAYYCGCDHCDDDVLDLATQLEDEIFAVVGGRFREYLPPEDDGFGAMHELVTPGGSRSGGGGAIERDPAAEAALRARLATVPEWWAAWLPRSAGV